MSLTAALTALAADAGKLILIAKERIAVPPGELKNALYKLGKSNLGKVVATYMRNLSHLPGLPHQLVQLSRALHLPGMRRGLLGELSTALRLEKLGTTVFDIGRNVYLNGVKFTDIDVMTLNGSVIEVRDWASKLSVGDLRNKVERLVTLRDSGVLVDGVLVERLYIYAPGGLSKGALKLCESKGIKVLTSASELAEVI